MTTQTMVHPTAVVDEPSNIGSGSKIWHFSHVMSGARIGECCILGQNVFVGSRASLGNGVKVQNNVSIYDAVSLEDDVFCGPSVVFTNVVIPRAFIERKSEYRPTLVKRGASLGANATIVCGVVIGEYALVGAGAVITRDVPAYGLALGTPARRTGWVCQCGLRLAAGEGPRACATCGRTYQVTSSLCTPT